MKTIKFAVVIHLLLVVLCVRADDFEPRVVFCCVHDDEYCLNEHHFNLTTLDSKNSPPSNFSVMKGMPNCTMDEEGYPYHAETEKDWSFTENGSVVIDYGDSGSASHSHEQYCLRKNGSYHVIITCYEPYKPSVVDKIKEFYPYIMLSSIPFLVVTLLVYALLKELRNLHGKCLMCYLIGLICFFVSLCTTRLVDVLPDYELLCEGLGMATYFSVLVCFFWLNTMCFDIYSTFSRGIIMRGRDRKRFSMYCLYAFGVPLLVTLTVAITEHHSIFPNHKMEIVENSCFIRNAVILFYVYLPMGSIIGINMLFYAITAYKIYKVQKETSITRKGDSSTHSRVNLERSRFYLYLRLFVVMGVTWIIEILSYAAGESTILHIADIINCLQGLFIFVLFVWKPSVKKLIIKKFKGHSSNQNRQTYISAYMTQMSNTSTSRILSRQQSEMSTFSECAKASE